MWYWIVTVLTIIIMSVLFWKAACIDRKFPQPKPITYSLNDDLLKYNIEYIQREIDMLNKRLEELESLKKEMIKKGQNKHKVNE